MRGIQDLTVATYEERHEYCDNEEIDRNADVEETVDAGSVEDLPGQNHIGETTQACQWY